MDQKLGWLHPGLGQLTSTPPMHLRQRRQSPTWAMIVPPVLLILLVIVAITSIPLFLMMTSRLLVFFGFNKLNDSSHEIKTNLIHNISTSR